MEETILMSEKEVDRYHILRKVLDGQLTQIRAAELLDITDRQVRNLINALKVHGHKGIISKKRGKPGNHQISKDFKEKVLHIVRTRYEDFGPTFANEKLWENHKIKISTETLRLWMIEKHLWIPKIKRKKIHLMRQRRECFGEMIQIDGSHHNWFGISLPKAVLIVFIDDATGIVTSLHFTETENLNGYFESLEKHLERYGRPRSIYSDRFRIFVGVKDKTQFQKALSELDITLLLASSPQAKGRVERVNRTLQDRLVKELRLRNITSIEEANRFLPRFLADFNRKFSKEPISKVDAHRPLEKDHDLERILCRYEERIVNKDFIFQFDNRFYKLEEVPELGNPKGKKIEVRKTRKGAMKVFREGKILNFKALDEIYDKPPILDEKERYQWKIINRKPISKEHPWKKYGYQLCSKRKAYQSVGP